MLISCLALNCSNRYIKRFTTDLSQNCFKACVCRNPVIDLSSKVDISDIPDWSWVECGLDYDVGSKITPEVLQLMWEHSPIRYIDQVKTPTLVLTGKQDLRVPPSQSVSFYQGLKARGVTVRMNVYEDCHSLSKPAVAADAFMHAVLWFKKHLQF